MDFGNFENEDMNPADFIKAMSGQIQDASRARYVMVLVLGEVVRSVGQRKLVRRRYWPGHKHSVRNPAYALAWGEPRKRIIRTEDIISAEEFKKKNSGNDIEGTLIYLRNMPAIVVGENIYQLAADANIKFEGDGANE